MTSEIKVDTISEQTSANGVTIDGLTIKDGNIIGDVALAGTTPTFTVGDGGAEDASLIFDGNAQDFYVALDDSADDLVIGLGSTVGTTPIMSFDESKNVTIHDGTLTVESDNANALMAPLLKLDRISSSPADGDLIGAIRYTARLDSGSSAEFAGLEAKIIESSTADGEITLNIAKGGNVRSALKANNTEVIINDASEDIDFRVESNGKTHALFVDGGNDKIGIINSTPNSFETGYNDLVVGDTDTHHGLTIVGGTSHQSSIAFADGTSGNAAYRGSIYYNHASDAMVLSTGATQVASFHTDGIVFNENSNDQNFRVEGADDINNFFVDAGNNRIGIGQGSPNAKLDVDSSSTSQIAGMFTASSASFGGDGITRIVCTRANTTAYEFMRVISGGTADVEYILRGDGNAFADQSWNASGADYAEYFEWKDGNSSDEDRRGYPVILDGNKIVQATDSDDASKIIGIISGNPAMVGDGAYTKWNDKYQKDDFGTYLRDENGYRILNTNYDETKDYVPRENRKEWDTVGLMGKLRLRKGEPTGTNWIKMRDISDTVEEWLVR